MAKPRIIYEYTGEHDSILQGGYIVKPGEKHDIYEWAKINKKTPKQMRSKLTTGRRRLSNINAINAMVTWASKRCETSLQAVYEYSGNIVTTYTGVTLRPGDRFCLGDWLKKFGVKFDTWRYRFMRKKVHGYNSTEACFLALTMKTQDKKKVPVVDYSLTATAKYAENKNKRTDRLKDMKQAGSKMAQILACRVLYPAEPCGACRMLKTCYGDR